jgi:DNA-binding transcriptional MerR regulator
MSKSTQTQLMTASEVAAAFGRDTRTISRWTREGRLTPTTKLPGKTGAYLYDASQIQKLAKRAKPVVEAPKAAS